MNTALALVIAAHVWGPAPCGAPSVTIADSLSGHAGWVTPGDCTIYLARGRTLASVDAAARCALIVHEYGHLTGRAHSSDERNVMHQRAPRYWRCERATRKRRWR